MTTQREASVSGAVTGLALVGEHYFVGTALSNMFFINGGNFRTELRLTCHSETVNDIVFPSGLSAIFATCCGSDIRLWNASTCSELLRIEIPDRMCNCLQFSHDGSLIISGWSDGKLRCFGPQSGKLVVCVNDAHKSTEVRHNRAGERLGVTAVCSTHAGDRIITGGSCGLVRVWNLRGRVCQLEASLKEHKAGINAVMVSRNGLECVSASDDGSCIIWDIVKFIRRNIMYAQTYFRAIEFAVDESQFITCGSDKNITYWDAVDCTEIRQISGSRTGELNSLSTSSDSSFFATGGNDRILKVWDYDRGECIAVGIGHSCSITKVRVSPDQRHVVSVGDEGVVMIWKTDNLNVEGL